jgi:Uma2 family endonuclease
MAIQERLYTAEELWEIAHQPEYADKRLELIRGVIQEMPPSSPTNTVVTARFVRLIGNYVDEHDLGFVTGADDGFTLGPNDVRLPDAAFISKSRITTLPEKTFPFAPDLAVEVVSPSETSRKVLDKVRAYLESGTRVVWAAYAEEEVVDVHHLLPDGAISTQTANKEGTLDGEDVLPGFMILIRDLFKGIKS